MEFEPVNSSYIQDIATTLRIIQLDILNPTTSAKIDDMLLQLSGISSNLLPPATTQVEINTTVLHPGKTVYVYTHSPIPTKAEVFNTYTHVYLPDTIIEYHKVPYIPEKPLYERPLTCRKNYWNPINGKCGPNVFNEVEYLAQQAAQVARLEYIKGGFAVDEPPAPSTGGIMIMSKEQKAAYKAHNSCGRSGRPMSPYQF